MAYKRPLVTFSWTRTRPSRDQFSESDASHRMRCWVAFITTIAEFSFRYTQVRQLGRLRSSSHARSPASWPAGPWASIHRAKRRAKNSPNRICKQAAAQPPPKTGKSDYFGTPNHPKPPNVLGILHGQLISRVGPNEENDVRALRATCIRARFCRGPGRGP
jgi:hypothetical protein